MKIIDKTSLGRVFGSKKVAIQFAELVAESISKKTTEPKEPEELKKPKRTIDDIARKIQNH